MPSETLKQGSDGENHRQFSKDIKGMVSAITHCVSELHKPGSSRHEEEEDRGGATIITVAGTNHGATMRKEMDEKSGGPDHGLGHGGEPDELNTYVNSNFQAVNNSIMFGSHYTTNDPGVHMEVSDVTEHEHEHGGHGGKEKEKKKEKKKEKEKEKEKKKEKEKEKGKGKGKGKNGDEKQKEDSD